MARREMTVERFHDIKVRIELGESDRQIARALQVRRTTVAKIRRGEARDPSKPKIFHGPAWAQGMYLVHPPHIPKFLESAKRDPLEVKRGNVGYQEAIEYLQVF